MLLTATARRHSMQHDNPQEVEEAAEKRHQVSNKRRQTSVKLLWSCASATMSSCFYTAGCGLAPIRHKPAQRNRPTAAYGLYSPLRLTAAYCVGVRGLR